MTIQYQAMTTATGASQALANAALLTAFKAIVVGNSAWSVVEDTSGIGSSPYRYVCFKCDHTVSGLPNDFYVLFSLASGTTMTVSTGEAYNSGTHVLSNCCAGALGGSTAINSTGQYASSPTVTPSGTGAPTPTGTVSPNQASMGVAATSIFWHAVVYNDHIIMGTGASAAAAGTSTLYLGGYTSLVPTPATNDPYPIVQVQLINAVGGFSREPLQFASTTRISPMYCYYLGSIAGTGESARAGCASTYDGLQANYPVSRALVQSPSSVAALTQQSVRGVFTNVMGSAALPASIVAGDTVTYNGTSWEYLGSLGINSFGNLASGIFVDTGS